MKITTENNEIILSEVYNGIGIRTANGDFYGICERDNGIEILRNGEVYFTNTMLQYMLTTLAKCHTTEAQRLTTLYSYLREE